jgi:DNA-binding IscR family transcriptional regulator
LEKASKKAGIPVPVVKKILEALKADNLVESEKIGIGAFYWSFPSKAYTIVLISDHIVMLASEYEIKTNRHLRPTNHRTGR